MGVRLADRSDHPALTAMLTRAFDDDPVMRWVFPRARVRARWGPGFFRWSLWRYADQDVTWTTDDRVGAAVWALPDRWRVSMGAMAKLARWSGGGLVVRGPLVMWGLTAVEARHPKDRHLYLAVLGVDPDRQGAGVGSALITPGLELCDRDGIAAYLETGKERNLAFYGRHGFEITEQLTLPAGPPVWLMRREPR